MCMTNMLGLTVFSTLFSIFYGIILHPAVTECRHAVLPTMGGKKAHFTVEYFIWQNSAVINPRERMNGLGHMERPQSIDLAH